MNPIRNFAYLLRERPFDEHVKAACRNVEMAARLGVTCTLGVSSDVALEIIGRQLWAKITDFGAVGGALIDFTIPSRR